MIKAILFDFGGVIYKHPRAVIPRVIATIFNQPEEEINKEYQKYKNLFFTGKISPENLLGILKDNFPWINRQTSLRTNGWMFIEN